MSAQESRQDVEQLDYKQLLHAVNTCVNLNRELLSLVRGKKHINPNDGGIIGQLEDLEKRMQTIETVILKADPVILRGKVSKLEAKINYAFAWAAGAFFAGGAVATIVIFFFQNKK